MKQIQDILKDIRNLNFSTKEPAIIYNESCKYSKYFYTITIFATPEQLKIFIAKYGLEQYYDAEPKEIMMNFSNAVIFDLNPGEDVHSKVVNRLINELEFIPILDDNYCFQVNDYKYQLDYCHVMTNILLIFQVDEIGTPISCDFMCCDEPFEPGKPIPRDAYEYLINKVH